MFLVIILNLYYILPTLGQELSYIPEYLHEKRPQQAHDYSHPLLQDGFPTHHYGLPVKLYKVNTSPSLSKLYKPRPAELDKILMGYHNQINIPHLKPKDFYRPDYPKQSRILKTSSQHKGKHYYERPIASHSRLSAQKEYADYYKKAFYSKLRPAYVSNNYDDNYGYKTAEAVSEEDPEYNYDFSYSVSHPDYNLNFGHKEDKHGKLTKGIYYVLLPDGRTQYVEYEADAKGYKPRITYDNQIYKQYR